MLRTEIQRLKAIDIHSCPQMEPLRPQTARHQSDTTSLEDQSIRKNSWVAQLPISDSETSEGEPSDVADFESFIKGLRNERPRSSMASSGDRSLTDVPNQEEEQMYPEWNLQRGRSLISKGTETEAFVCVECSALKSERNRLLTALREMKEALMERQQTAKDEQERAQRYPLSMRSAHLAKAGGRSSRDQESEVCQTRRRIDDTSFFICRAELSVRSVG